MKSGSTDVAKLYVPASTVQMGGHPQAANFLVASMISEGATTIDCESTRSMTVKTHGLKTQTTKKATRSQKRHKSSRNAFQAINLPRNIEAHSLSDNLHEQEN